MSNYQHYPPPEFFILPSCIHERVISHSWQQPLVTTALLSVSELNCSSFLLYLLSLLHFPESCVELSAPHLLSVAPQVYFKRLLSGPAEATFGSQMPKQKHVPLQCNGKQILTFRENVISEILKIFMWKRHLFNWIPAGNKFPLGCYVT